MYNLISKPFGLHISENSMEVVSFAGTRNNPQLLEMGIFSFEPGLIENGNIIDKEKLADFIKKSLEGMNLGGFTKRKFIFSIPESKAFVFNFLSSDAINNEDFLGIVKKEIGQTIPFPLEDLYFDFRVLTAEKKVLVVVVQKKIIDDYLEFFSSLKIEPIFLEIESLSLARVLLDSDETVLIMDVGKKETNFSVFENKELRTSISSPVGGDKFTEAISKKTNLSLQESELLKQKEGFNFNQQDGKISLILGDEFQVALKEIKEIKRHLQENGEEVFKKIIITGESSNLPNILTYLAENTQTEVIIGNPWRNINTNLPKYEEFFMKNPQIQPTLYSKVVGLALRGLSWNPKKKEINLIKNKDFFQRIKFIIKLLKGKNNKGRII
jgi:type IV pilus assembly protein PilM